ncbi:MAG: anion permease [Ferruginibacter sp.]
MTFLIVIIILALVFDYINGFHDAANSIATIVSTKVLTPFQAVLWAAFFNFIAFLIFNDHAVANTIGKTVFKEHITLGVIFAGLVSAIAWNLLTWWWGIPSSSSHTLIGGFAGAAIAHAYIIAAENSNDFPALHTVIDSSKIGKTILFIFLAPLIGMLISIFFTLVTIARNTWVKTGILLLCCLAIWFKFQDFQTNKINENFSKYFKVDKYDHEIEKLTIELEAAQSKNNSTDKINTLIEKREDQQKKLEKSKALVKEISAFTGLYERAGANAVADSIIKQIDLHDIEISKIGDKLALYLELEKKKVLKDRDSNTLVAYTIAQKGYDAAKPIAKKRFDYGFDAMTDTMMVYLQKAGYPIRQDQINAFRDKINVDVRADLVKEMKKADNTSIRWSLIGILLFFIIAFIVNESRREPSAAKTGNMFKKLQLLSSAAFSIGHGGNDAQKVMGIIAAALVANGSSADISTALKDFTWVPLACYIAIGLGTLSGGWKIVKTMGTRITKVSPLEGVCAETAGASTLFLTEQMGIPVSTTHTITGSIIGVGATKRLSAVRWGVTINLLWAWILTIPISAILAALAYWVLHLIFPNY